MDILLILILLSIALFLGIAPVRRRYISTHLLSWFQKKLPDMSASEAEALNAGYTTFPNTNPRISWEKELFSGSPNWDRLTAIPTISLSDEEIHFLNHEIETFCSLLDEWQMAQQNHTFSEQVWSYIKAHRLFGLQIPKAYGGHGFSVYAHSQMICKISTRSVSAGITVMVPNALGSAEFLVRYGTETQKQFYLPRLATGEEIPAFALTSLEAGSDATAIKDYGIVCEETIDGQKILGIKLYWHKRYITLAPIATLLGLAVKLYDPDQLLGEQKEIGITLCLVPTHLEGVEIGKRHHPCGLSFLNGPTQGQGVFIPLDNIVGGPTMRGKGWSMLMNGLAQGRGISLPALSTAIAQVCYRTAGAYAKVRTQFHRSIGEFEGVAQALGKIGGYYYQCEAIRRFTLRGIAEGTASTLFAAISKYHTSELARAVTNQAMDIHAGHAIQQGALNYLSTLYEALPIAITVEGANILTRGLIIFGQGALHCHPYLRDEIKAAQSKDVTAFEPLFFKHIVYFLRQSVRLIIHSLTNAYLVRAPKCRILNRYYQQLTHMSNALAWVSEIVFLTTGKAFKQKESISARLGDILSDLYKSSSVIKCYQDEGKLKEDEPLLHWTLQKNLQHMQYSFEQLLYNMRVGWVIYKFIFLFKKYLGPKDALTHHIARNMMQNNAQRKRLTPYFYLKAEETDKMGRIELAFEMAEEAQPLLNKFEHMIHIHKQSAQNLKAQLEWAERQKIFSEAEFDLLKRFIALRAQALRVDEQ